MSALARWLATLGAALFALVLLSAGVASAAAPTANAGPNQLRVKAQTTVTLDGTASFDPDNDPLFFSWVQVAGPAVTVNGANGPQPTFTAPTGPSSLTFQLIVSDGVGTDSAQVTITVNGAPVANAGPDQVSVKAGTTITLNAIGSVDPDADPLSYSWVQVGGGTVVGLNSPNTAQPTFTASNGPDVLVFQLTADDGVDSSTDTVSIQINGVPTASAGPDQPGVQKGALITLDGSNSTDPDGNPLTYSWTQTSGPAVVLQNPATVSPSFVAPQGPATLSFQLVVSDGTDTDIDTVTVSVGNNAPSANAGPDQTVAPASVVTLDGSASTDPDNDPLAYSWIQTAGPAVALAGASTAKPTFTAPASGTLAFRLTVQDGGFTATDLVTITVSASNHAPTANAGPDQTVPSSSAVILDGSASSDPEGDRLTYRWAQVSGPIVALTGTGTATPTFTASQPGTLVFRLTVSDGAASDTDTVSVTVTQAAATVLIEQQLATRGTLMLASQPDVQDRIGRLNGTPTGSTSILGLMAMFPQLANGGGASFHGSLAAYAAGNARADTRFDAWVDVRYARTEAAGIGGSFVVGSLGADYLVTPDLLAGGFVSVDHLIMGATTGPSSISGTGWLAGGYLTGRLSPNLYLDGTLAAGTSWNTVNPAGTYSDDFATARVLASTTLTGEWRYGAWTFLPRARIGWFGERSAAYTDSLGVPIPSITQHAGELAVGPGFVWTHFTDGGTRIAPALRFDAVGRLSTNEIAGTRYTISGRVEPRIDIVTARGLSLGLGANVEFGKAELTYGGSARLSFGFN